MRLIKIGMVNHNPTVGAFDSNIALMVAQARALGPGCHVVVFPEGAVSGYPCEDLVLWPAFVREQWSRFETFAKEAGQISPQTLYTFGGNVLVDGHVHNAIIGAVGRRIVGLVPKMFMADGNVFYDSRSLDRGQYGRIAEINGVPFGDILLRTPFALVGLTTCEDVWAANSPIHRQAFAGADLLINQSASPFRAGVVATREELLATRSAESMATLVYVNQYGANDALVFDGGAYVFQNGRQVYAAPRWRTGVATMVVDLDRTTQARLESNTWRRESLEASQAGIPPEIVTIGGQAPDPQLDYPVGSGQLVFLPPEATTSPRQKYFADLYAGMTLGLGDYFRKSGVFERFGISSSGGMDSALSTIVAWQAMRDMVRTLDVEDQNEKIRHGVFCISQPTGFNSANTKSIARTLATDLGVTIVEEPIEEEYRHEAAFIRRIIGGDLPGSTDQNIQARYRAMRMWNLSNAMNMLFVYTGNMSETSVGYTTIGGDLMGAYGPIRNVPKTVVRELLRYLWERYHFPSLIPLLNTRPSAELRPDQTDEGDLMPYPVLDALFFHFAGRKVDPEDLPKILRSSWTDEQFRVMAPRFVEDDLDRWSATFLTLFFRSIFKWVQSPLGAHLGGFDLDRERAMQIPVVHRPEWLTPTT